MSKKQKNLVSSFKDFVPTVKEGEKKDMEKEMAKTYQPAYVEEGWYSWWREQGYFKPQNDSKKERYVMMLPPPNVTGNLHIGHALTSAIQDSLIRFHKMMGKNCLYLPGVDHAGIATQVVVEKQLQGNEGKTRHDLGRDKFIEKVWEWKEEYGEKICTQLKRMGSSLDWSRFRFTMDERYVKSVNEAFIRMYNMGLIYRDRRLVNWDCTLRTAISNIEVDYYEWEGKTVKVPGYEKRVKFGYLWSFAYELSDGSGEIIVSTTRPETMLGDTGVAVHPDDERYKKFHGKTVKHPFLDRKVPIVCDSVLVKMDFGSGAVKITPAHDPHDFECGVRHNLEFISLLNDDGTMNKNAGPFAGMKRYDCRNAVLKALEEKGLYKGEEKYHLVVGVCSRSKDIIEPIIKPQWYVKCKDLAEKSSEAVRNGELKIFPKVQKKKWFRWMENIHDWCISRQLWWGHRCPAYFAKFSKVTKEQELKNRLDDHFWIVSSSEEEAKKICEKRFEGRMEELGTFTLEQDEDVLDTWFSSGLFPFATLGWPDATIDLKDFFPGSILETGWDILFFWVARMVMMSYALTGKLPFKHVYLHSMVRDKEGGKMSKTEGNVIDPIDCIEGISLKDLFAKTDALKQLDPKSKERGKKKQKKYFPTGIPECGTDALRFTLMNYITNSGLDINMDVNKVFGYRTFCNKIWNATLFAMKEFGVENYVMKKESPKISLFMNRYILNELNQLIENSRKYMSTYMFAEYTNGLYHFFVHQFCDDYIESVKIFKADENFKEEIQYTIFTILETFYRLIHPTMPFLSEELWQRVTLPTRKVDKNIEESIMLTKYPKTQEAWKDSTITGEYDLVKKTFSTIRSIKGRYSLTSKHHPKTYIICNEEKDAKLMREQVKLIQHLGVCGELIIIMSTENPEEEKGLTKSLVTESIQLAMFLKGIIDFGKELAKLEKKKGQKEKYVENLRKKLSNEERMKKMPEHVQNKMKDSFQKAQMEFDQILSMIEEMKQFA